MILFADTNILLDLYKIDLLKDFFSLDKEICMEESIFEDELIEPKEIQKELLENGLQCVAMNNMEFLLAQRVYEENPKLSFYDCVAFSVAKYRGMDLLTGDKRLRRYAERHQVKVYGLLWTIKECEREGVLLNTILNSLEKIYHNERIRIPNKYVVITYVGIVLRKYRRNRIYMDYHIKLEACTS